MHREDEEIQLSDICARLKMDDPLGMLHEIYHVLDGVYLMNAQRHDENVGDDMATFAQLIYRNSWAQLESTLPLYDREISASRPNNSLVIHTPGPDLKVYRGGRDESFDIELYDFNTGSITKRSLARDNELQLSLFDFGQTEILDEDRSLTPNGWVFVHSGNPDDGLVSVWIGAPRTNAGVHDSAWSFVFQLPDLCEQYGCRGTDGSGGLRVEPSPVGPSGPSYDALPEPEIVVHPKTQRG